MNLQIIRNAKTVIEIWDDDFGKDQFLCGVRSLRMVVTEEGISFIFLMSYSVQFKLPNVNCSVRN
jgi:hypothetical protein